MVKRRGGGVPLGDGRAGVPLTEIPGERWVTIFREAAAAERPDDERWQHAALNATADEVDGVPYLMFVTGTSGGAAGGDDPVLSALAETDADFIVGYIGPIDGGIAKANEQVG
jgi:hypothetical protein